MKIACDCMRVEVIIFGVEVIFSREINLFFPIAKKMKLRKLSVLIIWEPHIFTFKLQTHTEKHATTL